MMPVWFGAMNMPMPTEFKKISAAKPQYEKSTGSIRSRTKVSATMSSPPVAKGRAPNRSANTRYRTGQQETDGERDHIDAGPQWRLGEAVAVEGEPDALQPDDQHEHQTTAAERRKEAGDVPGREGPDPEQGQPEHGIVHSGLDDGEDDQDGDAAEDFGHDDRARPTHGVVAVGE